MKEKIKKALSTSPFSKTSIYKSTVDEFNLVGDFNDYFTTKDFLLDTEKEYVTSFSDLVINKSLNLKKLDQLVKNYLDFYNIEQDEFLFIEAIENLNTFNNSIDAKGFFLFFNLITNIASAITQEQISLESGFETKTNVLISETQFNLIANADKLLVDDIDPFSFFILLVESLEHSQETMNSFDKITYGSEVCGQKYYGGSFTAFNSVGFTANVLDLKENSDNYSFFSEYSSFTPNLYFFVNTILNRYLIIINTFTSLKSEEATTDVIEQKFFKNFIIKCFDVNDYESMVYFYFYLYDFSFEYVTFCLNKNDFKSLLETFKALNISSYDNLDIKSVYLKMAMTTDLTLFEKDTAELFLIAQKNNVSRQADSDLIALVINNLTSFTESEQINFYQKLCDENNKLAKKKIGELDDVLDQLTSEDKPNKKIDLFKKAFKLCFDFKDIDATNLKTLNQLYKDSTNTTWLSPNNDELCFMILMAVYFVFVATQDQKNRIVDGVSETDFNTLRDKLSKTGLTGVYSGLELNGIQKVPGWLETNQIKYIAWEPQVSMLNKDFYKYYSALYNFVTGKENPFNDFIDDDGFKNIQKLAIQGREALCDAGPINDFIAQAESYIYDSKNVRTNGTNSATTSKDNLSIYQLVKTIGDLAAELSNPVEFKKYTAGINFYADIYATLNNTAVEIGSSLILNSYMTLFSKKFIEIGANKYSISDIYFELTMLNKIFELCDSGVVTANNFKQELTKIKNSVIDADPTNPNCLGTFLESEGYFAISGLDFLSTESIDVLTLVTGGTSYSEKWLTTFKSKVQNANSTSNVDSTALSWSLYQNNKNYWYFVNYLKTKVYATGVYDFNFDDSSKLLLNAKNCSSYEKAFSFMCSVKDMTNFKISLINEFDVYSDVSLNGYLKKLKASCASFNGTGSNKVFDLPLGETTVTVADNQKDKNFNYYTLFTNFMDSTTNYHATFVAVLDAILSTEAFQVWESNLSSNLTFFANKASVNKKALVKYFVSNNVTPLLDTVARMLPTSVLLFGKLKFNISKLLKNITELIDLSFSFTIKALKDFSAKYKKSVDESYELITWQILKKDYSSKIYSFNVLLDIIFENIGDYSFCLSNGSLGLNEVSFSVFKKALESATGSNNDYVISDPNNTTVINNLVKISNQSNTNNTLQALADSLNNKVTTTLTTDDGKTLLVVKNPGDDTDVTTTDPITIFNDQQFVQLMKTFNTAGVYDIAKNTKLSDFLSFITPTSDILRQQALKQIISDYFLDSVSTFNKNNDVGSESDSDKDKTSVTTNVSGVSVADAGYVSSVDFSKANSKLLFDSINKFNYTDFIEFKYTNFKLMESLDNDTE